MISQTPTALEDLRGEDLLVVHTEEQHRQGIALSFVEYPQATSSTSTWNGCAEPLLDVNSVGHLGLVRFRRPDELVEVRKILS
jgi:hypothetical protein